MTTARSAPCPCGSGLKYKRCHGSEFPPEGTPEDVALSNLRRAIDSLTVRLLSFTFDTYGRNAIQEAWEEFLLWPDEIPSLDLEDPHYPVFMAWFFHVWSPDPIGTSVRNEALHEISPAKAFLQSPRESMPELAREYLEAAVRSAFSFYEIVRVDRDHGFRVRDVFTSEEFEVLERSSSKLMREGCLIYAMLVSAGGVTVAESIGEFLMSGGLKDDLLEFANVKPALREARANSDLANWDIELRDLYLNICGDIGRRRRRQVHNSGSDDFRKELEAILSRYYEQWVDESLPALGGKSPRQAVEDPQGREEVRALVEEIASGPPPDIAPESYDMIMTRLRQTLGLVEVQGSRRTSIPPASRISEEETK